MGSFNPSRTNVPSVTITKTTATHDMASGASDTTNARGGSTTLTLNGSLGNNASITLTIVSDKVLATDVVAVVTNKVFQIIVHTVSAGGFKATLTNKSGGTYADDMEVIINWVVL